jgi:nucleotide-binding universal stress UspA family protein
MLRIRKILAPTDLSELSQDGVRLALEIAKSRDAEVTIYHVVESNGVLHGEFVKYPEAERSDLIAKNKKLLATFLRERFSDLFPAVKISQAVEVGVPYRKILDRATKENADLIVMSTHGRTGLLHCLIGSVAEMVVRLAACPVLSVQPTKQRREMVTEAA